MRQSKIIGVISAAALSLIVATLTGHFSVHTVYADANCEKAHIDSNPAGNEKGNVKQCDFSSDSQGPKEPVRNCNSPNHFKDNDADGLSGCANKGK